MAHSTAHSEHQLEHQLDSTTHSKSFSFFAIFTESLQGMLLFDFTHYSSTNTHHSRFRSPLFQSGINSHPNIHSNQLDGSLDGSLNGSLKHQLLTTHSNNNSTMGTDLSHNDIQKISNTTGRTYETISGAIDRRRTNAFSLNRPGYASLLIATWIL